MPRLMKVKEYVGTDSYAVTGAPSDPRLPSSSASSRSTNERYRASMWLPTSLAAHTRLSCLPAVPRSLPVNNRTDGGIGRVPVSLKSAGNKAGSDWPDSKITRQILVPIRLRGKSCTDCQPRLSLRILNQEDAGDGNERETRMSKASMYCQLRYATI